MSGKIKWLSRKEFFDEAHTLTAPQVNTVGLRKSFVTEIKTHDEESRQITFTISTQRVDRDNDTIDPKGWLLEDYLKNPVVLWAHNYHIPPVGKATEVRVTGKGETRRLQSVAEFMTADMNAFADQVYRMVKGGWLNATSVGFIPLEYAFNEERGADSFWGAFDFTKQDLLEYSIVPVPSNADALVEARGLGIDTNPIKDFAIRVLDDNDSGEFDDLIRTFGAKHFVDIVRTINSNSRTFTGKRSSARTLNVSSSAKPGEVTLSIRIANAKEIEEWVSEISKGVDKVSKAGRRLSKESEDKLKTAAVNIKEVLDSVVSDSDGDQTEEGADKTIDEEGLFEVVDIDEEDTINLDADMVEQVLREEVRSLLAGAAGKID